MFSFLFMLGGCDLLGGVAKSVQVPTASLNRVDLVQAPTTNQALAWGCYELLSSDALCVAAGFNSKPSDAQMLISFDLVFDLTNNNEIIAIPLVELLLAITVIKDTNLGAVCISFCDPEDTSCSPGVNAEDACTIDDADQEINEPEDLIPTVDDLVGLAESIAEGDIDNGDWRLLPPLETVEGHVQFDLNVDTTFKLAKALLEDAIDDVLAGRNVKLEVPYTIDGSVFFDVPELGRYAVNFGPISDVWPLD